LRPGPGNYRVADFLRAGSGLSVIHIVVSLAALNLIF
jgi:di/tricarboxylate transporter